MYAEVQNMYNMAVLFMRNDRKISAARYRSFLDTLYVRASLLSNNLD